MSDTPRIYIDSCCLIDAVSHAVGSSISAERQSDIDYLQLLMMAAKKGEITAFTSVLTITECQYAENGQCTDEVKRLFRAILESGKIFTLVQSDPFLAVDARDLRWKHNIALRGMDSMHVASAHYMKCGEFITVDGASILNKAEKIKEALNIRVIRPSESLYLPQNYKQVKLEYDKEPGKRADVLRNMLSD